MSLDSAVSTIEILAWLTLGFTTAAVLVDVMEGVLTVPGPDPLRVARLDPIWEKIANLSPVQRQRLRAWLDHEVAA